MSKIVLRNVQLINWYGFTNTVVPVAENLTLISGENECGKSTILDAIKYAYTGDTQFNKATSGYNTCLLYTSDAADEEDSVDLGGRRIIKKKKKTGLK